MKAQFFIKIILRLNVVLSLYYSVKFRFPIFISRGSLVSIKKGAKIKSLQKGRLFLGFNSINNQGGILQLDNNSELMISGSVNLFSRAKIVVMENACLKIGGGSFLNEGARIQCRKNISIGRECSFSWDTLIIDSDFHGIYINNEIINQDIPVKIGNKVWLGAKSIIQKGVEIDNNVIIGSHSLVLKGYYQSNTIYAGLPARYVSLHHGWGKL